MLEEVTLLPELDEVMEKACTDGTTPGATLLVSTSGEIVHAKAYGLAHKLPDEYPMRLDTIFDLSSLTKILATTSALMLLIDEKRLSLEDRVARHIPGYSGGGRDRLTIADLLVHSSGLPDHRPYYRDIIDAFEKGKGPEPGSAQARELIMQRIRRKPLTGRIGEHCVYSDLGFILLTNAIENVAGVRLDKFCTERIFKHLGMRATRFYPMDETDSREEIDPEKFAATEFSSHLNRYMVGEVHDGNAHAMGGVSGHAGLFSTIEDVHTFALNILHAYQGDPRGKVFSTGVAQDFWRRRVFPSGIVRAYGWDVPSHENSTAGKHFSPNSFGHLGYTGTSLWIDATQNIIIILFTNRVHPTSENNRIRQLRPLVHDTIMEKLKADRLSNRGRITPTDFEEEDEWNVKGAAFLGSGQVNSTPRWIMPTYSHGVPGAAIPKLPLEAPEGIFVKCKACREIMYRPELERNFMVCPKCGHHHYLSCWERIMLLADEGSFEEVDLRIKPTDPLKFKDSKSYSERLKVVQKKQNTKDAFRSGRCTIDGRPVQIGVFDFRFMGGSMGSVVGEKVTRVFERATAEKTGAIVVSASGGARMQEGVLSLMQMAKSCAALSKMKEAGLPYISILAHPTTGGVAASFAMLGDVNISEPKALIGFAGPRVIEQSIRQKLPPGFQRAEYLLGHGMIDMIVHRNQLRDTVSRVYSLLFD